MTNHTTASEPKCPFTAESIGHDIRIGSGFKTPIDLLDDKGFISSDAIRAINNWLQESYLAGIRTAKDEFRNRLGL